jgi:hypothetical protein
MSTVTHNLQKQQQKLIHNNITAAAAVPNNNEIVVSISDIGPSIDSEILPRLFTKFATKSTTGTGLGLFISKSIIDAHGGKIWGKNNYPEGKGATFGFAKSNCIMRSLKYSRELAQIRIMRLNQRMIDRFCGVKISRTTLCQYKHDIYMEDSDEQESVSFNLCLLLLCLFFLGYPHFQSATTPDVTESN